MLKATIEVSREWGALRFGNTLAVAVVLVSVATVTLSLAHSVTRRSGRWFTCHVPQLHRLACLPVGRSAVPAQVVSIRDDVYLSNHVESKCERAHMQSFHLHSNIVLR